MVVVVATIGWRDRDGRGTSYQWSHCHLWLSYLIYTNWGHFIILVLVSDLLLSESRALYYKTRWCTSSIVVRVNPSRTQSFSMIVSHATLSLRFNTTYHKVIVYRKNENLPLSWVCHDDMETIWIGNHSYHLWNQKWHAITTHLDNKSDDKDKRDAGKGSSYTCDSSVCVTSKPRTETENRRGRPMGLQLHSPLAKPINHFRTRR